MTNRDRGDWTPGPLTVESRVDIRDSEGGAVALLAARKEMDANARLIAAAPDMAELLKQALELESMSGCPACCEGNDDEGACLYHGIRALFAKINGENDG